MVENPVPNTKMDLGDERWAQSPQKKTSEFDDSKNQNHILKY